jgi:hypothetical protein
MIILKKTGIFYESNTNPTHKDYIYKMVDSIIPYLDEIIKIEESFTLGDFFKILKEDEERIVYVFSSYLGHNSLSPFIEEIQQDCMPNNEEELGYIECSWYTDQFDYRLFYEQHKDDLVDDALYQMMGIEELSEPCDSDENEITIAVDVHGVELPTSAKNQTPCILNNHGNTWHGIEFTPLHKIAHLPIKLNTDFKIYGENDAAQKDLVISGKKDFSVIEIFGAMLSEITFCGLPEKRNGIWDDITDKVKDVKENYNPTDDREEDKKE